MLLKMVSRPCYIFRQEDMGLCNAGSSIIHTANWKYSTYSEHINFISGLIEALRDLKVWSDIDGYAGNKGRCIRLSR